jgi:Gas vesicle protein K
MSDATLTIEPDAINLAMRQLFKDKLAKGGTDGLLSLDPEKVEHDIAKLVLTLVEFLRRLLEMQAVRRMEAGKLSEEEEENLGLTLMRAEERILELAKQFGLEPRDLSLDLGPLGRLM